ncbi:unnamed protein product [Prorocentrum cordatum]|uniref:Uncharacterized protein n=1 Tax=Prorocentrum cordatum TaxID=2364126 RepID=A0ABN9PR65_9DINO|nr:unnamed protein product [Polarella glacialis]
MASAPRDSEAPLRQLAAMVKNAVVMAVFMVAVLVGVGAVGPPAPASCSTAGEGYTSSAMSQDLRAVGSFCLGAVLCSIAIKPRAADAWSMKVSVRCLI